MYVASFAACVHEQLRALRRSCLHDFLTRPLQFRFKRGWGSFIVFLNDKQAPRDLVLYHNGVNRCFALYKKSFPSGEVVWTV